MSAPNVGLDIGSYAIKIVVGQKKGDKLHITQAIEQPNPAGSILSTDPRMREVLLQQLKDIWQKNNLPTRNIRVSLPESMVVTKIVNMPKLSDAELASAIHWQIEQHIPIPYEELQYEYLVLRRSDNDQEQTMDVLIVGVQKQMVQNLADLLLDAGLDVVDLETDTLAQLRCLEPKIPLDQNLVFLHIGATSSTMTILNKGFMSFVYAFPVGGFLFTRAIEKTVLLDPARAEEYKRTYGLLADKVEGKVRSALQPVVQSLAAEVQKALHYFVAQRPGESVTRMYVHGGSQYLPDLFPFLSQNIGVEVLPTRLADLPNLQWTQPVAQDSRFVTAVGLALKETKG
jgi:type IV pilus assembly protein PilM